tara:strand:- start:9104 stop:10462 length:1359 start_codon:yes stop_codon:yes gene_type:complete
VLVDSNKRSIPAVETLLKAVGESELPRPLLVATIRQELNQIRTADEIPDRDSVIDLVKQAIQRTIRSRIQPVINATGIIVHTNLGRAPLGSEVVSALGALAGQYNNLEYDLTTGERGGRANYVEAGLATLCQSEAATIVNNCAAALVLILRELTSEKREVIVSRGELIQIGGGFRIPDILETSGATLREVGTTNRTNLADYETAIGPNTGLILKVHRSNFFMDGFVESPLRDELSKLARESGVPLVEDLGSGALTDTEKAAGLTREPTPAEAIRAGVDLVCFSGDKLMGGPQAGIIAGNAGHVGRMKRNPFFRALRCDRLVLGAMQAVVDHLLADKPTPVSDMMSASVDELRKRAETIRQALADVSARIEIGEGKAQVGGGTLPRDTIPSVTLDIHATNRSATRLAADLRRSAPPVISYPSQKILKLDLRTVFPEQDETLTKCLGEVLRNQE